MEKSVKISCIFALCVVLLFGSIASATMIDDIVILSSGVTKWFDGGVSPKVFQFTDMMDGAIVMGSCEISIQGSSTLDDYVITGTVHVSPSSLIQDQTALNGGWAKGLFAGESTLTIYGKLYERTESGDVLLSGANDVLLLEADMYDENWEVIEGNFVPQINNEVFGQAYFDVSSGVGLLNTGALGLTIGNFKADFTFKNSLSTITDFSGTDSYMAMLPSIQINAIPEPISVCLLAFGSILVTRKRR